MQKSVIWCWLQELICSCVDVVPSPSNASSHSDDVANDIHISLLPNPSAVLKTVSALIARMEKSVNQLKNEQQKSLDQQVYMEFNGQEIDMQKQQAPTATDTKQQIVVNNEIVQLKSILKTRENKCVVGSGENNNGYEHDKEKNIGNCAFTRQNLHAHETYICGRNNHNSNNNNAAANNDLVEDKTELKQYHQQLINEKSNNYQELPLRVNLDNMPADVVDAAQEYKLFQLYATHEHQATESAMLNVSKRIEFFEHSATNGVQLSNNNKETIQTTVEQQLSKGNIFSIYRVVDLTNTKQHEMEGKEKLKKVENGESPLLRHDSNVLTALLSCMFIGTFLLLIFFPLSA